MIGWSTSAFILARMRAGRPARACSASRRIISTNRSRMPRGATSSFRKPLRHAEAGQHVEEVGQVLAQRRVAGEEPEVGVEPRGARVVVAGADVHVAPDVVALAAHHQHDLGVGLEPRHAVAHVDAHVLQPLRPDDVVLLVEARLQLDQHRHLLAPLGGVRQQPRDAGVAAGAVERQLDGQHVGVVGGLLEEALHRGLEAVVRVVQEEVALADDVEDVPPRRPAAPG